jgi:NitT/TauT family transport system substrate-binding protein
MLRLVAALALAIAFPALAQDKFTLQLNWFHLADHSPIYLAMKKGYYKDEGLDLTVLRGAGSADSAKKVDLKQADLGISDAPTVITAISKGADLKMVAVVFDKAGQQRVLQQGANIQKPQDLVGKKIAVPPADSHRVLWPGVRRDQQARPERGHARQRQARGQAGDRRRRRRSTPRSICTRATRSGRRCSARAGRQPAVGDYGLPIYGHTYFVNTETEKKNPKLIERFLRATHKGWRDGQANPAEAIDAMVAAVPGLDRDALLATTPQIYDLCITERSRKNGIGWIEQDLMQRTIDITFAQNKPDKPVKVGDVFTNAYSSKIMPTK